MRSPNLRYGRFVQYARGPGSLLSGMTQSNLKAIRRMFQAFETGNMDDLEDFIAHNYLNHESVDDGRSEARGQDEVRATVTWMHEALEDLAFEEQEVVEQGDTIAMWVTMRGKHTGSFFGIPAEGKRFPNTGRSATIWGCGCN
jgi:predicted ester cyclase